MASFAEDAAKGSKESGEILKQVAKLLTSEKKRQLLEEIGKSRDYYLAQRAALTKAKEANNTEEASKILDEKFVPAAAKYQELLRELLVMQRKQIDNSAAEIGAARRVAKGDLNTDVQATSKDEAGQMLEALREMTNSLRGLVTEVMHGTSTIASASGEIAQVVVHQVVDTMASIDASPKKIVDIISVIDGIAFQTNILALNAAVEAAPRGRTRPWFCGRCRRSA